MGFTSADVTPVFRFGDKRRRDKDNLLASLKAAFDGLTDAGVWTDDSEATYLPVRIETGYGPAGQGVALHITGYK